ncbi:hypothetical protein TIFTF001_017297 [Ficus carica]|uniref:Phospholipase A1 n=1 Tax=Ficus carica TaxID=3494 RepID=A0AA88A1Z2_FICCA|nr:hypothetical protein TIFTF001_017297 [Ficus carica]
MSNNIAKRWRVLSGEKEWEGLLDPLDINLRHYYVIHYGEKAQAIADAFIAETKSKHCGALSLYTGRFLLQEAVAKGSNCIGYLAVATDEGKTVLGRRDILVVWRGSMLSGDWTTDFTFELVSAKDMLGSTNNPMVHKGWYSLYTATNTTSLNRTSAQDQVFAEVKKLVAKYQNEEISITVTGHSMGAALATLNAVDLAYNKTKVLSTSKPNKNNVPVTAYVFTSPRVRDKGFGSVFSELSNSANAANLNILRINELLDVVVKRTIVAPYGSQIAIREVIPPFDCYEERAAGA